jgi:hypothetical protein
MTSESIHHGTASVDAPVPTISHVKTRRDHKHIWYSVPFLIAVLGLTGTGIAALVLCIPMCCLSGTSLSMH